jgi:hypothetical protein
MSLLDDLIEATKNQDTFRHFARTKDVQAVEDALIAADVALDERVDALEAIPPPGTGAFRAYRTASPYNPGNAAPIAWDTEEFDFSGWFDVATGRYTPPYPCVVRITAFIQHAAVQAADTYIKALVRKNAVAIRSGVTVMQRGANDIPSSLFSDLLVSNGTDIFEIGRVSDAASNLSTGINGCFFSGELIYKL